MTATMHLPTTAATADALRDALHRIRRAWLVPLARLGAIRHTTGGDPGWGTPVSLAVLDVRQSVAATVYGWARVLIEDRDLQHARVGDVQVPPMCDLLTRHADWLSGHEAAHDMAAELTAAAAAIEKVTPPTRHRNERRPGERINTDRRIPLGECSLIVTGTWTDERDRRRNTTDLTHRHHGPQCSGLVIATLDQWGGADATCRSCGTTADVAWWEHHVQPERLVTMRRLLEIAQLVHGDHTSEKALRNLLDRGVIDIAGRDAHGRRLVDRAAALAILAERRARCRTTAV